MIQTRKPAHPGRILKNMYLTPLNLTITGVSEMLGVSRKAISAIVNERKSVTPEMALRFSVAFSTTAEFWANLQKKYDLWYAANHSEEWKKTQIIYPVLNPV